MSLTKECCTLPPVESDYTPKGTETQLESSNLTIYETGNLESKKLLLCYYDIFGFHPNSKQVCDKLGSTNEFHVVTPGFFRGGSKWNMNNFPPKEREELLQWVGEVGSWEKSIKADTLAVIEYYKAKKGDGLRVGLFGFCWGGKMSILGGCDIPGIVAVGLVHAAFDDIADAERVQCPVLYLPSKTDADVLPHSNRVKERLGPDASEHHRFEDMEHGFAAARGDFKDPLIRERVDQAVKYLYTFFLKHFAK